MSKEQSVSIPVFWRMCSDNTIHQSNAVSVFNGRVEFDDGGWNPVEDCFFSEEQCRTYHGLPPKEWEDFRDIVRDKLQGRMNIGQAIDCVRTGWNETCPVGQKQAANTLLREVLWLRENISMWKSQCSYLRGDNWQPLASAATTEHTKEKTSE